MFLHGLKFIFLFLWQLPQNIVGMCLIMFCGSVHKARLGDIDYFHRPLFGSGVCLGEFIIIDSLRQRRFEQGSTSTRKFCAVVRHEAGHRMQSRMLGPLYLLVIGLPSLCGNLYNRARNKGSAWYYSQPWEAWADRLGGVERGKI